MGLSYKLPMYIVMPIRQVQTQILGLLVEFLYSLSKLNIMELKKITYSFYIKYYDYKVIGNVITKLFMNSFSMS